MLQRRCCCFTSSLPASGEQFFQLSLAAIYNGGSSWNDITGATSAVYDPPSLTTTTKYQRRATDNVDCGAVYSNGVTVTISAMALPDTTMNYICTTEPIVAVQNLSDLKNIDSLKSQFSILMVLDGRFRIYRLWPLQLTLT